MSDKFKDEELDELKSNGADAEVKYEENDNWEFEATAHTLENTLVEDDEFEIIMPEEVVKKAEEKQAEKKTEDKKSEEKKSDAPATKSRSAAYETRERPTADKSAKTEVAKKSSSAVKGKSNLTKFLFGAIIAVIVIGVLVFFGIRYYTVPGTDEKMNFGNIALTVKMDGEADGENISVGMYNYYYSAIKNNYLQYAQSGYYNIDESKDFSEQYPDESFLSTRRNYKKGDKKSWEQVFEEDTTDRIQYITALYIEGVKHDVALTAEQKKNIETQLENLKTSASDSNLSVDEYIEQNYGKHCGLATIKKVLTQAFIANNYYRQYLIENKATKEEVDACLKKNEDTYMQCKIGYLPMPYDPDDATARAKTEKQAEKYLKQIKSVDDMKLLIPKACKSIIEQFVAAGNYPDEDTCAEAIAGQIELDLPKSDTSFTEEGVKWLFDSKTKVGSKKVITDTSNAVVYIVLKLEEPKLNDAETYSVRHILVTPEAEENNPNANPSNDGSAEYTDEQWEEAKNKADKILAEYKKGNKTEFEFAELAEKYSADTESTSKGQSGLYGGLLEGCSLGQYVPPFEKWATNDSRKYGNTGIVKSDFGYHIMYFIEDVPYYYYSCEQQVIGEKGDALIDSYKVEINEVVMNRIKKEAAEDAAAKAETTTKSEETTVPATDEETTE
ncbi:MAG: hypothetical protein E7571_06675 [Ruminococcaceae bacterium]|nr:hypothetical protein [Oscillospiraceae bacterium]